MPVGDQQGAEQFGNRCRWIAQVDRDRAAFDIDEDGVIVECGNAQERLCVDQKQEGRDSGAEYDPVVADAAPNQFSGARLRPWSVLCGCRRGKSSVLGRR